jgi:hypothetical protein
LAEEAAMRYLARKRGADEEQWGVIGLIHDLDYEKFIVRSFSRVGGPGTILHLPFLKGMARRICLPQEFYSRLGAQLQMIPRGRQYTFEQLIF